MEEEQVRRLYFEEEQHFPLWIKAIVLLSLVPLVAATVALGYISLYGPSLATVGGFALTVLLLILDVAAVLLHYRMKLVTELDSSHLHIRIYPLRLILLPYEMTRRDIPLSDIAHWEVRVYKPILDREYWGWGMWGLRVAKGGRAYLYVMRANPISGRGVQLQLVSGERLLIGSQRPEELAGAITLAKSESQ